MPSYPQPDYQNPAHFDPLKPENKKDLVKFLDKQKKLFLWPKPNTDKIYYKTDPKEIYKPKPVENYSYESEEYHSEEKKDPVSVDLVYKLYATKFVKLFIKIDVRVLSRNKCLRDIFNRGG